MTAKLRGRLLEDHTEGPSRVGLVEFGGKRRSIYLNLVPEAKAGDFVWFHSAFATEMANGNDPQPITQQPAVATESADVEQHLDRYRAYRLLSDLDSQHLRKLLPLAQDKEFAAGEIIFHCGDSSLFLHLIVSGDVALEDESGGHVHTLHACDAMGWSALTATARTHFQARAVTRTFTVAFPGLELRGACERDPAMGYALMVRLVELVTERLDTLRGKLRHP